ncbi:glycoside hydrolase family 140 protein [Ferruginibacter sp. SUN106]|uniref:glycoside hydrolase family 140 protein n=1 Tax=Ferruginibacter sp. SUN106 TaxID=2978348 RepID=UPI003D36D58B
MKKYFTIALLLATIFSEAQTQPLKISANKRYFQTKDGKPFFWLGDTGWLLFKKCKKEDAIKYLDDRKSKGFNVIQVMLLHELNITDVYGDSALINKNIAVPNLLGLHGSSYWDNVDLIIKEAEKRGIYMALVPVWGGNIKQVSVEQAKIYAAFLANRYKNYNNIIWLNGGDIKGGDALEKWNAIGNTIRSIDKNHLIGFHPRGRNSSSAWFHNEAWLDFNMFQSGHKSYEQDTAYNETLHYGEDNWRYVNDDYALKPLKPTFDGEPSYENIPHGLHDSAEKRWTAADVRRYAYWSVFAGGCGFTYGNNSVMQFYRKGNKDMSFGANKDWDTELNTPGAAQMQYLKTLILSKSYFDRVPDQSLVTDNGEKYNRVMATKGKNYALFYVYNARAFKTNLATLNFKPGKATWFSPVDSQVIPIKNYKYAVQKTFDPPGEKGDGNDWVLILEK